MSDYLSRLAAKNLNPAETVQPRFWSHFEPPSADDVPLLDRRFGSGEGEDGSAPDEAESHENLSVLPTSALIVDRLADPLPPSLVNRSGEPHPSEEVGGEMVGSVRRREFWGQLPSSETMRKNTWPDSSNAEMIPATSKGESDRTGTLPSSHESSTKTPTGQVQLGSSEVRVDTKKYGSVRETAAFSKSPAPETMLNKTLPDPNKSAAFPVTARGETQGTGSQSFSQEVSKLVPSVRRQPGSSAPTATTKKVGAVFRGVTDREEPSIETISRLQKPDPHEKKRHLVLDKMEENREKFSGEADGTEIEPRDIVLKRSRHDRRRQASSSATVGTGMVRRDERTKIDDHLTPYDNISLQTFHEPKRGRGQLGPERVETTTIAARGEKTSTDMRQQKSSVLMTRALITRNENIGTIRRKAAAVDAQSSPLKPSGDAPPAQIRKEHSGERFGAEMRRETGQKTVDRPSPSTEPISDRPGQILEVNKILPRPAKVKILETSDGNGHQPHEARREEKTDPVRKVLPPTDQNRPKNRSSIETMQPPSYLEMDRSLEVGFDGRDGAAPNRGHFKIRDHNPRAAVIAHPEAARFFEPGRGSSSPPVDETPTIHVKIGRVEVRAAGPPAPISKPPRNARSSAQKLSLDEYLKQRNGGRS